MDGTYTATWRVNLTDGRRYPLYIHTEVDQILGGALAAVDDAGGRGTLTVTVKATASNVHSTHTYELPLSFTYDSAVEGGSGSSSSSGSSDDDSYEEH